jgi:hypothetical protein
MSKVGIAFLLAMLSMPLFGQGFINIVRPPAVGGSGPTCSGSTSETFEGSNDGYDLANWNLQDGGSGQVDPDDTTRTEDYFSGDSLHIWATSGFSNRYIQEITPYAKDPYYMAFSLYIDTEGIGDGIDAQVARFGDAGVEALCVRLAYDSPDRFLELWYGDDCYDGGTDTGDSYQVSLDNVYIIEMYADNVGASTDVIGWRIFDCGSGGDSCDTTPEHTYEDDAVEVLVGSADRPALGFWSKASSWHDSYYGFLEIDSSQVCN